MDPYEELANAIVLQAVQDYRSCKNEHELTDIERFFRSTWFGTLTGIDPEWLIAKLRKEKEARAAKTETKPAAVTKQQDEQDRRILREKKRKKTYSAAYYAAHKQEVKAKHAAYYQAHKDERDAYCRAYVEEHRAKINAYQREYRQRIRQEDAADV